MESQAERWQKRFEEYITLVAEIDTIIVGFADMTKAGYLDHLYVHKEYQAQGVAYALFKHLETIAQENGLTKITTHASINAMPLARRVGFVIVKKETISRHGVAIDRYDMEKPLV